MVKLSDEDAVSEWKIKWDFVKCGLALTLFAMHIRHVSPFAFKSPSFWFVCFFLFLIGAWHQFQFGDVLSFLLCNMENQ